MCVSIFVSCICRVCVSKFMCVCVCVRVLWLLSLKLRLSQAYFHTTPFFLWSVPSRLHAIILYTNIFFFNCEWWRIFSDSLRRVIITHQVPFFTEVLLFLVRQESTHTFCALLFYYLLCVRVWLVTGFCCLGVHMCVCVCVAFIYSFYNETSVCMGSVSRGLHRGGPLAHSIAFFTTSQSFYRRISTRVILMTG